MIEKLLIRAPSELKKSLKDNAQAKGVTLNAFCLQILWEWMSQNLERRKDNV